MANAALSANLLWVFHDYSAYSVQLWLQQHLRLADKSLPHYLEQDADAHTVSIIRFTHIKGDTNIMNNAVEQP